MHLIHRSADVIQELPVVSLAKINNFPVFIGCVTHPISEDVFADLEWQICPSNGLIQLGSLVPLDVLYSENQSSALGHVWSLHHQQFAQFIFDNAAGSVLEIGGAHGALSIEYSKLVSNIDWTIIEPNPIPLPNVPAKYIRGFFDDTFQHDRILTLLFTLILLNIFIIRVSLFHISSFLSQGKKMLFSIPHLEEWLKKKYTNCINFEHTIFLTEPYVEYILAKYHFRVDKKYYFGDTHSIFYSCTKVDDIPLKKLPSDLYESNKNIYKEFADYYFNLIDEFNLTLSKYHQTNLFICLGHTYSLNISYFPA